MKKLTLEHIAPYLPYKLMVKLKSEIRVMVASVLNQDEVYTSVLISSVVYSKYKPILRPMDLTKPIKVDGKEVIPIVELAKIVIDENPYDYDVVHGRVFIGDYAVLSFDGKMFLYFLRDDEEYRSIDQLALFKWLYANKFDVDGLINATLAIDVNTLETNPYE